MLILIIINSHIRQIVIRYRDREAFYPTFQIFNGYKISLSKNTSMKKIITKEAKIMDKILN